jgi:thiamine-monophosphate kinase
MRQLLEAGGVGAELLASAIPISRAARLAARGGDSARPALLAALQDGEDFELLFTVASRQAVRLVDAWKARFPKTRLSCIGKITAAPGLKLRDQRGMREFTGHGYVHFQKS